jgi:hypothetical protein
MSLKQTKTTVHREVQIQPVGSLGFDWAMLGLSAWLVGGAFVDGWAHTHGKVDTAFFTPWHAAFYSGFVAVASFLVGHMLRNLMRGYTWRLALPAGYGLSLLGALVFCFGGMGDLIWHTLFGIEKDVEALLSPTHLVLACGVWLIASGPFRAAWQRAEAPTPDWVRQAPMLLSLACMLSVCTFITQIAHPIANLWGAGSPPNPAWLFEEMGVVSFLLDTGLLMGLILLAVHRWRLPLGALTLVLTLNAIGMGFLFYRGAYPLLPVAARGIAGLVADLVLQRLKPSGQRLMALRLFACAVSVVVSALYFVALQLTVGIWWSIHFWAGVSVLTGVVGVLLSYLLAPPPIPGRATERP